MFVAILFTGEELQVTCMNVWQIMVLQPVAIDSLYGWMTMGLWLGKLLDGSVHRQPLGCDVSFYY